MQYNDYEAVQDAVRYIVSKGYDEMIYISPPLSRMGEENLYGPEKRYLGFIETCRSYHDVQFSVINHKNYLYELALLLRNSTKRTAIFCSSDIYALDIIKTFREKGYQIPEDVGIMGFDNIDMLQYVTPAITTVDYSAEMIGNSRRIFVINALYTDYPQNKLCILGITWFNSNQSTTQSMMTVEQPEI